jgi:MFS family permease
VLAALALLTCLLEIGLALTAPRLAHGLLYGLAFVLGGLVATQYYVTSAHTNDRTSATQAVQISSTLLFLYCVGAVIGPITASELMRLAGSTGLFWHNAAIHAALCLFVIYRISKRPPAEKASEERDITYRPVP